MMTREKIIEYVLYTPNNPNRSVLKSMLDSFLEDNGGSCDLENKVIFIPSTKGQTTFEPSEPRPGDKVTITPIPNPDYSLSEVVVVDINGKQITVVDNGDGTFSYIQPANGTPVVPIVDFDSIIIDEDGIIIYDGGPVEGWQ